MSKQIADQLRQLADQLDPAGYPPVVSPAPPVAQVDDTYPPPSPGNWYREPRVQDGHPDTVTMPETGHVLSVAAPHMGENIIGYLHRVSWQAHGDPGVIGSVMVLDPSSVLGRYGYVDSDPSTWPKAADRFYNEFAYMTQQELQEARRQMGQWPTGL